MTHAWIQRSSEGGFRGNRERGSAVVVLRYLKILCHQALTVLELPFFNGTLDGRKNTGVHKGSAHNGRTDVKFIAHNGCLFAAPLVGRYRFSWSPITGRLHSRRYASCSHDRRQLIGS